MSFYKIVFKGNSLFVTNLNGDKFHYITHAVVACVNRNKVFYIKDNGLVCYRRIYNIKNVGGEIVVGSTTDKVLFIDGFNILFTKKKMLRSFNISERTMTKGKNEIDEINRTNLFYAKLDNGALIIEHSFENNNRMEIIDTNVESMGCGDYFVAYIKNGKLIIFDMDNSIINKKMIVVCDAEKIACGQNNVIFLNKGKLFNFGVGIFDLHYKCGDSPVFITNADDFQYENENLSVVCDGALFYCDIVDDSLIFRKVGIEGCSLSVQKWKPENHEYFSSSLGEIIFTFLLVNKRKGKILPKYMLFKIFGSL